MSVKIKRLHPNAVPGAAKHFSSTLRDIEVGSGLPSVSELREEFDHYWDVLIGRVTPPINNGVLTLMEVADAYYARAMEVEKLIHQAEREERVFKGGEHYRYRTGELRDFTEMAKRAAELGSRRLTHEQWLSQAQRDSGL